MNSKNSVMLPRVIARGMCTSSTLPTHRAHVSDYRHGSHTTFSMHLHIVWITKYRHKVLRGEVAEWVRAIVREECQKARGDILQGHIAPDHVHVMISIPPHVMISRLIQRMQGQSS